MVWLNGLMLEENFVHIIFLAGNFEVILKSLEWLQYEFRLYISFVSLTGYFPQTCYFIKVKLLYKFQL